MKASRRNIRNAHAQAEKRSTGKPPLSKYEAKRRGYVEETPAERNARAIPTIEAGQ